MIRFLNIAGAVLLLFILECSDQNKHQSKSGINLEWTAIDSLNQALPEGIAVYQAVHTGANLRAWYVHVKEPDPLLETRVVVSADSDGTETVSDFARRLDVPVLINGGYFRMDLNPAKHVGILKVDGELIHAATASVLRGEQRFFVHRAALGLDSANVVEVGWASSNDDTVFSWSKPIMNFPTDPGEQLVNDFRKEWRARDILGGGPQLIRKGKIDISINPEVFFGTTIPDVHPRTAAGITSEGDLILLLVDGRQLISRGVSLEELADILFELGCVDALNLDGGGSSALIVNGILLNKPAGTTVEREVMSALAVYSYKD